jgi:hypothetical protein
MPKKIHVPRGKELHAIAGNYRYIGPRFVIVHRGLKLPKTFTDGTKWYYVGEEPEKKPVLPVAPKNEEKPVVPKKTKKRKPKVKLEEKLDDSTNESISTEGESPRTKYTKTNNRNSKRDETF